MVKKYLLIPVASAIYNFLQFFFLYLQFILTIILKNSYWLCYCWSCIPILLANIGDMILTVQHYSIVTRRFSLWEGGVGAGTRQITHIASLVTEYLHVHVARPSLHMLGPHGSLYRQDKRLPQYVSGRLPLVHTLRLVHTLHSEYTNTCTKVQPPCDQGPRNQL